MQWKSAFSTMGKQKNKELPHSGVADILAGYYRMNISVLAREKGEIL